MTEFFPVDKVFIKCPTRAQFFIPLTYNRYTVDSGPNHITWSKNYIKLDSPDGSSIVVKKFAQPFASVSRAKQILREINLLRTLRHENVVTFMGSYKVDNDDIETIYHITEYSGNLVSEKIKEGKYQMEIVKKWIRELLRALQYLHSHGEIHRDLHPNNICIDDSNRLIITDFGLGRYSKATSSKEYIVNWDDSIPQHDFKTEVKKEECDFSREIKRSLYRPIEDLTQWKEPYDEKADMWSVAAILCELITGQTLFKSDRNLLKQQIEYCGPVDQSVLRMIPSQRDKDAIEAYLNKCERQDFMEILLGQMLPGRRICQAELIDCEESLRDFIDRTLQFNPNRRMSTEQALAHPFLHTTRSWMRMKLPTDEAEARRVLMHHIGSETDGAM